MTKSAAYRCSVDADLRGDPMPGTAPPQERVLLVHQPGPWGPRGLIESRCDPGVARRIDAAAADAGMRLQTIRRPGKHEIGTPAGGHDVGIADTCGERPSITWWSVNDLAEIAAELEAGRPRLPVRDVDYEPVYLVCAHGRHDPCCALRGRPVAAALERVRPGRVWETTHLGGDRFAANLLVLPSGDLYGRVPADTAVQLADHVDAGEVLPGFMRGRIGLSPIAQAAMVYAHRELGIAARAAIEVLSVRRLDEERAVASLATSRGPITVTIAIATGPPSQLTCHGPSTARAREYHGVALEMASAG